MIQKVIRSLFACKKISTLDDLFKFVVKHSSQMSGELVVKYSQKRLGKIHYTLSKNDKNYAKELVSCQSQLHSWVMLDYYCLLMKLTELPSTQASGKLIECLLQIHKDYVNSAPTELVYASNLCTQDFQQQKITLRDIANNTGKKLFKLLPMTDQIQESDVAIFQGQVRLSYINFLTNLDRRIKPTEFKNILMLNEKK